MEALTCSTRSTGIRSRTQLRPSAGHLDDRAPSIIRWRKVRFEGSGNSTRPTSTPRRLSEPSWEWGVPIRTARKSEKRTSIGGLSAPPNSSGSSHVVIREATFGLKSSRTRRFAGVSVRPFMGIRPSRRMSQRSTLPARIPVSPAT